MELNMPVSKDPTPEQIASACLEIQATWTERERLTRLRVDWRPSYTRCDGEREMIDAASYERHHANHQRLKEAEVT